MIPVYRNVDSPNGDFGLTRQEGDEEFVVLTKAEYAALCPVTSPGAHGEGEAVTLWKYRDSHVFRRSQPRSYRYGIDEEFKALPAAAFDALVASRKDAEESVEAMTHVLSERIAEMAANAALLARANTAKVLLKEARYFVDLFADDDAVDLLSRIDDALGEG